MPWCRHGHRAALTVIDIVIGNDRVSEQGWTAPLFRTRDHARLSRQAARFDAERDRYE